MFRQPAEAIELKGSTCRQEYLERSCRYREDVFRAVFEGARKQKSSSPYLSIQPKEMKIQMLGEVGIVTFHLEDPGLFGRRTVVFHKRGGRWLIVHLHASGIISQK
jgi:hypothetical protein